ncbi:MAG: hypothetical protein IPM12_09300 [Flavobacteriales bacterium]|nr:hypothetical protein [Flavobacteriales bacterium]
MKHRNPFTKELARVIALLLLLATGWQAAAQHRHDPVKPRAQHTGQDHGHEHEDIDALLNRHDQRITFMENGGQFGPQVLYRADFPLGQAVATAEGMVVTAFDPVEVEKRIADGFRIEEEMAQGRPMRELQWRKRGHSWRHRFIGASDAMRIEARDRHPELTNYFVGERSALDASSFQEVWYTGIYRGIDARYYPAEDGSLEYDLIVMPGGDPGNVAIAHEGIERMHVNDDGELVIETILGEMAHPAPYVYQRSNGRETRIDATYKVDGNVLRFTLGAYDRTQPLVIDPIAMRWATWINTNSSSDNHGHCIWVDPSDGAIYVVARVTGTTDQITPGAFDETTNGGLEMIVGKYLEPATVGGSGTRVWQTYIGGNGDDNPYAMEQGPDGNLYITGQTSSTNFPLLGGTAFTGSSVNQQAQSGIDVFVLKINTAGNSIKAAVVGGNGSDDNYDVRLAANGDVFVAGSTTSTNLLTVNPGSGASNTNNGGSDVFLFRINQDLSSLVWMRNYGGSSADRASIMLHNPATGDLFVGGNTSSTNFPTLNPRQSTRGGSTAGFLQRLNGTTAATVWSSYYSSASSQNANLLCMEFNTAKDELCFGGVSSGLNSANLSAGAFDTSHNGSNDFYVGRMTVDQTFIAGTYIGGSGNEENMMGLNTDQNDDVYVFGYSGSSNFPVSASPDVPLQTANQGSRDKVFFKLNAALNLLEFSTYYGGTNDDYDPVGERGIKFSNCRIYTIVTAQSNNIPLTQGAVNTTKNSPTSRYEPGLVVWANPPDLLGNSITYQGVSICPGATPGDITGSEPSYSLPTIVRNNVASGYPAFPSAATYQWQISPDSLNWTDIPGATGQNLSGAQIGALTQDTYIRRIIGGDACILAGAADQVVKVRIMTADGTVTDALCNGAATGSITATADGQAPFSYAWSNGQTSETAVNLAAGPYSVTVTDFNGCSATANFVVGQPAPLSANVSTTLDACGSGTGSAAASGTGGTPGYSYLWSTGTTGPNLTNVSAGAYSVQVTDFNQCSAVVLVNIDGTLPPSANAGDDVEINCTTGATVQLNGSSQTPGVSFSWTGPGIVNGGGSANPTVNAPGTYTLTVTNTQTGCTATDQVDVTVNTTVPGAQAAGGTITCGNECVMLTGTGNGSFAWSGPNNFSSTEQNPTVCAPGTYTLVVTGTNGCTSTATAEVEQDTDAPGAQAAGGTITCGNECVMLTGTGNGSFAWSGPNNFSSTEQNPTVCAPGTYTLVVTGTNGCTSTATAEVEQDTDAPGAQAAGGTITCGNECVMLTGTGNGSFAWSGPNNFSSTEQNPTVCAPGTYTLVVTGTNGCTSTATAEVEQDTDAPGAQAAGGTITCGNECVMLTGTGNGSFAWSGPNNFSSTEQNPTVCAPGTYTLVVTGTNGCTSTATAEVEQDTDAPGAQAAGGTITCGNECVMLTGTGNGSFAWSGPNNFSSTEQNPTVCAPGTYTLVVTGTNGCTSTATAEVEQDTDAPGAQAAGGTITCGNECVMLTGTGNGSFAWSGPNNFSSTEQNPTVCAPGTYTLVVTGTNGCTSTATAEVEQDTDAPGAQAAGGTITCGNTCVMLTGTGNGSFAWSGPNNFSSTEQNPHRVRPRHLHPGGHRHQRLHQHRHR